MKEPRNAEYLVFVGTYTQGRSEAIFSFRMSPDTGSLEPLSVTSGFHNPSFLAIEPRGRFLYAVSEINETRGSAHGVVNAFSIARETGELTHLNQESCLGPGPCHLVVDHTGRFVLVANYIGGSVCVLPIREDGRLGEATDFVQHHGSSVNPDRQQGPHAHSFNIDVGNQFGFVADLGMDKIMVYKLDLEGGKLLANDVPWIKEKAGAGPRHFDFHPDGGHAYVINELGSTVTAFDYEPESGLLRAKQTVSTLPESFVGTSHCADVHVSPSGKFLYGSNRGHDSIAIFAIDQSSGELTFVDHESTQGKTPRNFAIEPAGNFLLAANQDSDTIVTFRVDQETGRLEPTGQVTQVPMPVCIKVIPN